jgi:predicted DNA-binding antitoxin AbrB/MazE fold protein
MIRQRLIDAVFEQGVFRPLGTVDLPEHQRVSLLVTPADDLPAAALARVAEMGGSFAFLNDPREDVYSQDDGDPV